jgi:hypothetical protein
MKGDSKLQEERVGDRDEGRKRRRRQREGVVAEMWATA